MASRSSGSGSFAPSDHQQESSSELLQSQQLQAEVEDRFGMLPNFFRLAPGNPEISASLWGFARFAYLDNPLPGLFKERLFVYLSRFCDVRYCVVRHLGFLIGLGRPAGDDQAPVQTIEQAVRLLGRPLARGENILPHIELCTSCDAPLAELPPPGSELDEAIFTCAAHVFLQSTEAPSCLAALEHVFDEAGYEYLKVFLAFVRTAHYWTKLHKELTFEDDVEKLMAADQLLSDCLLNDPEVESSRFSQGLVEELDELRKRQQHHENFSQMFETVRESEGLLRRSNAELAAHVAEARDARRAALNVMEDAIEAKDALRESQKRLVEADRRKNEFLATLAHELRNPLAPICNSVQIMRLMGLAGEVAEQARETIERQVTNLVRLVDDLLDVSRINSNKFQLRRERVALAAIVQSALETSRPLIETSDQELTVTLPSRTIWLDADLTRMAQALANLLNNAAKYTPERGCIRLSAEQKGNEAVVRVQDTGIGIPQEMLPHIFEMFRQVDTSQDRSRGGLGIGLTLVKSLVEMHGGTVEVHSDGAGRGSEFVLRLPVMNKTAKSRSNRRVSQTSPATPRRILVVDDNRDAADSLARLLEHSGHCTRIAHDGAEALETAASFRPDVILLDIGMPKLNGYQVAQQIRQQPWGRSTVLIAVTGWGQQEDRSKSERAGFDGHFVKPVDYAALTKLLARLLPTPV
jgi:signal transduction histidine kinase